MAVEETQRDAPEERTEGLEVLRRFLWGVVGAVIAFVLWIRFELSIYDVEPDWLSDGLALGLMLGAYFGMASWRGRRERAARGATEFALMFIVMLAAHMVRGLFTG
jgi:hypothetical protein